MKLLFKNKSDVINGDQILRFWIQRSDGDFEKYTLNADLAFSGSCGIPHCVYLGAYRSEGNAQRALRLIIQSWQYDDIAYLIPEDKLNDSPEIAALSDLFQKGI